MKKSLLLIAFTFLMTTANAQEKRITTSAWDGAFVIGTFNEGEGGFANFGGPSVKYKQKSFSAGLGMLPGVRIKEDKSTGTKNSTITPSLGFGLTMAYKHVVLQIPAYYSTKGAADGKWLMGLGLGFKL